MIFAFESLYQVAFVSEATVICNCIKRKICSDEAAFYSVQTERINIIQESISCYHAEGFEKDRF